jgi:hypothetical protein
MVSVSMSESRSITARRSSGAPLRKALLTAQALALGATLGVGGLALGPAVAAAQEATPVAGACVPPTAGMTSGTGAAASPVAETAELAATPASDEIAARAAAAVDNFVACWNSGDLGATLALVTPNLLQGSFGLADAQAAEAALPELGLGDLTLLETGKVVTYDDGRASVELAYQRGDFQHVDARWFMVERDGELLIDQEEFLVPRPEGDQAVVGYTIADDATPVAFDQFTEVGPSPVLVLSGINNGAERHVVRLVMLGAVAGAATPVAGEETAATVPAELVGEGTTVGLIALAPGAREDLALVGLPEGSYALVDDAVEGSAAALTIAAQPEA